MASLQKLRFPSLLLFLALLALLCGERSATASARRVTEDDLKVKFYIYESPTLSKLWELCYKGHEEKRAALKFILQLREHRWRTLDPSEASLFILPIAFMHENTKEGPQYRCAHFRRLIKPVINEIMRSPFYRRMNGRDHLILDPWWKAVDLMDRWNMLHFFDNVILGTAGVKRPFLKSDYIVSGLTKKCVVYVPFDSENITLSQRPLSDRPIDFLFLGSIDNMKPARREVFEHWPALANRTSRMIDVGSVLQLPQCPDFGESLLAGGEELLRCHMNRTNKFQQWMKDSKFSLMIRGHDFQSERLFSAVATGTLNVIFSDYIYETGVPFQCFVPWRDFSFRVSEAEFRRDPALALRQVVAADKWKLQEMQEKMIRHQRDVIWNHPQSRVAENVLISAVRKCFSLHFLEQKGLQSYKDLKCRYPDQEDHFPLQLDIVKEIQ